MVAAPDEASRPATDDDISRLAGLSPTELTSVQRYEAAHRGRKTILSKVAQLQSS